MADHPAAAGPVPGQRETAAPPQREHTRAAHAPSGDPPRQRPESPPIYRTAAFSFTTSQEYADLLDGRLAGYSYSRIDNPTAQGFAAALAALEGHGCGRTVSAQPFASGMAAISTVLLALTGTGRHVVAPREIYGGTYGLLTGLLARCGVRTTFVDGTDPAAVATAVEAQTSVVWAETLANPTMSVADIPALAQLAHAAGAALVVDSTFASPAVCRPLCHGADVVVHSATKYIGGHGDVTGGAAVGDPEILDRVRHARIDLGGALSPDDAWLLHRGLATLPLRMERHCEVALRVAETLAADPRLERVDFPGLTSHRDHDLARRLFQPGRFGAVVTATPRGGRREDGAAWCDALRLVRIATSLGGVHTKVSHVASTTHRQLSDPELRAAGIGPGAVRISVGLEDPEDLVADLTTALGQIPDLPPAAPPTGQAERP